MVEKVECFIRRLRWKAYYFCKENDEGNNKQFTNFGVKTSPTPPQNKYLNLDDQTMY